MRSYAIVCGRLSELCFYALQKNRHLHKIFLESLDETRKIWYDIHNYKVDKRNQLTAEDVGSFMLLKENFYGEKKENFIFYNTNYIA